MTPREEAEIEEDIKRAAKAVDRFIRSTYRLRNARYHWYLAEYEKKLNEDDEHDITLDQLEGVVHAFGSALVERVSAWIELTDILGL